MELISVAVVAAGFLLFALVSGRLDGTVITAPLLFVVFGLVAGDGGLGFVALDADHQMIHTIA